MMSEILRSAVRRSNPIFPPLVDKLSTAAPLKEIFPMFPASCWIVKMKRASRGGLSTPVGGMPGLLPLGDDERRQWLKDYGFTYLERDLGDLARLEDLSPDVPASCSPPLRCLLHYSEIARDAGASVDTARRYLEYLRLSYQTVLLPPITATSPAP